MLKYFNKLEVTRDRIVLPGCKSSLRIVAVSDLHLPCLYSSSVDFVDVINNEEADIFIVAGDSIDKKGNEKYISMLQQVHANLTKYAVLGNWEYKAKVDLQRLKSEFEKAGISLLINDFSQMDGVFVLGLDDFVLGKPDITLLDHRNHNQSPVILISHCPQIFDSIPDSVSNRIIAISGHTHGGQIAPFGQILLTPQGSGSYKRGWYHKKNQSMYVMRGIGTSDFPLRIGARPEILVLDIVGSNNS